jgi:23S rRNA (adenine2503-C2)-methyltransferase
MLHPGRAALPANLLDLTPHGLESRLRAEAGEPAYRARQILHEVYQRGVRDYSSMTSLPAALRAHLAAELPIRLPEIGAVRHSADGSRKYLLGLADGRRIEAVRLVDGERTTFCISSQVGCAFGCTFCLTARMGLVRQLAAGEIVGQVLCLADAGGHGREGFNIVLMGMGEPLHNFEAVAAAVETLLSPGAMALSYRRVTLSTVGHLDGIRRLATLPHRPRLAVSLNAADDVTRDALMPVNRAQPIEALLAALADYPLRPGERITFEFVLLEGINDATADADRLASLVRRLPCKVNVIPFNEDPELPFRRPADGVARAFCDRLVRRGVAATIRWSRGTDIRAACGQLVTEAAGAAP